MGLDWRSARRTLRTTTAVGEPLVLRPWTRDDAPAVYAACQDPEIIRWTIVPYPYTKDHAVAFVDSAVAQWESRSAAPFAVAEPATNAVMASCGLVNLNDRHSTVEIGYWVAPWARDRGVATAAARAVALWAFEDLGAKRVTLEAAAVNPGSQHVAINAGFHREGVQRSKIERFDDRLDMVLFSMLPHEALRTP